MPAEEIQEMYEVEQTHWWYRGMRSNTRAILERYLAPGRTYQLLDAGSGTGGNTLDLERWGVVTGLDYSVDALTFSASRGLRRLVRGTIEALPFKDESFDVVTSFDVICHGAVKDDLNALKEFRRVLRPGGIALVRLPAFDWLWGAHDAAVHTIRRYSTGQLAARMEQAGFSILEASYGNVLLFPLAVAKRWSERLLPAAPTDLTIPPRAVNLAFEGALRLEEPLSRLVRLPAGLSAVAIGRR
jgi:SAM-dependent methyltransferase